jgi:hypothetical protein
VDQTASNALIQTAKVSLTTVGLTVIGALEYDEWLDLMKTLVRLETAFQFAIGDALIFGEAAYGEKYSQAMDATGLSYQSLANMVWVSKHVPIPNRLEDVSWTHHRVVASASVEDQPGLLAMARDQRMSASALHAHMTGKESRPRDIVAIPPSITADEASRVLEQYAKAVSLANGTSPDASETDPSKRTLECILCASCPYKTKPTEVPE